MPGGGHFEALGDAQLRIEGKVPPGGLYHTIFEIVMHNRSPPYMTCQAQASKKEGNQRIFVLKPSTMWKMKH